MTSDSMVAPYLQKACLLTALVCLLAFPAASAEPSGNADDGSEGQTDVPEPCEIIIVLAESPFIEVHEECIPELP